MPPSSRHSDAQAGVLYAFAAYGIWGLMTVYWKQVSWVPSLELIAHRVVWTVLLLLPVLVVLGQWRQLIALLHRPRLLAVLAMTAALISVNWLGFVWAVNSDRVVQASLGYFINPLLSVMLGVLVLHERLRAAQWLALALAVAGVGWMVLRLGEVPWISLLLASTFAIYGLLRKFTPIAATTGLAAESLLVLPVAAGYLAWLGWGSQSVGFLSHGHGGMVLVASSGVLTALPLLCFANAARRLSLSTLGFVQYLAPTIQLLLGVLVYQEVFTFQHLIAFGLIWAGLAVYSVDSAVHARGRMRKRH